MSANGRSEVGRLALEQRIFNRIVGDNWTDIDISSIMNIRGIVCTHHKSDRGKDSICTTPLTVIRMIDSGGSLNKLSVDYFSELATVSI